MQHGSACALQPLFQRHCVSAPKRGHTQTSAANAPRDRVVRGPATTTLGVRPGQPSDGTSARISARRRHEARAPPRRARTAASGGRPASGVTSPRECQNACAASGPFRAGRGGGRGLAGSADVAAGGRGSGASGGAAGPAAGSGPGSGARSGRRRRRWVRPRGAGGARPGRRSLSSQGRGPAGGRAMPCATAAWRPAGSAARRCPHSGRPAAGPSSATVGCQTGAPGAASRTPAPPWQPLGRGTGGRSHTALVLSAPLVVSRLVLCCWACEGRLSPHRRWNLEGDRLWPWKCRGKVGVEVVRPEHECAPGRG